MKVRSGFVTNSSSSSYTCVISGETAEGYELGLSDCGMVECEKGHVFLEEFLLCEVDTEGDYPYGVAEEACPICMFKALTEEDLMAYLGKETGVTESEIFAEVKSENRRRKKLYNHEYINRVCKRVGKSKEEIQEDIFNKFVSRADFLKYL